MTFATEKRVVGRRPLAALELDIDTCLKQYGVSVTNLLTYSEDFADASWLGTATVASNADYSPFGALTADTLTDNSAAAWQYINKAPTTFDVTKTYAASVHIKKDSTGRATRFAMLRLRFQGSTTEDADLMLDTSTGNIATAGAAYLDASVELIERADGDWWRVSVIGKSVDAANSAAYAWIYPAAGASSSWTLSAAAQGGITAFGMQCREGSTPGFYVATTSSSATAACTASGIAGRECYNTYKTCQDQANYSKGTKLLRFFQPVDGLPLGLAGFPCIVGNPSIAPTRITVDKGLGWRGTVSVKLQDFPHHDRGMDPYVSTRSYDPGSQGSFFGKLKARNPYYKSRLMRLRVGYLTGTFDWANFEDRVYVIDAIDGPDGRGTVTIKGKDILALADDKRAQAPAPSTGTLSAAYTAGVSTTLVLQTGEGADYNTDPYTGSAISVSVPGYVRIGDNVLKYTGVSTDTLTGVVGGQFGSTDDDAAIDDGVQQCLYYSAVNVVDIIDDLLKTYAGLPEAYIPYDAGRAVPTGTDDEWDTEKANWLSANTLTKLITKPTGINELLAAVCEQNMCPIWWNEVDQEVKLKAIAPNLKNVAPPTLSDASHLIADSINVTDQPEERISQLWVHYGKIDVTGDDKPENYRHHHVHYDSETEGTNAYDASSIKEIFADWLDTQSLVITLAGRLLNRLRHTPRQVKFSLDARDTSIWTGTFAVLDTRMFQGVTGANEPQSAQVMEVVERDPGHRYDYVAQANIYVGKRYAFIAPDGTPDYNNASAAEKEAYAFIAPDVGNFDDGGTPYLII